MILCTILYAVMCMIPFLCFAAHVHGLNTVLITVLVRFHMANFHTKLLWFNIQFLYGSLTILESPPCEFLLYSREMVEDLINKLDDKDLDCVLTLDKG